MRAAAIALLVPLLAQAQVVVEIAAAWHDPESDAVEYAVWTNLPDPTALSVSLEWRGDTLRGKVTRTLASGSARPRDGECRGKLVADPAPLPPGVYVLLVSVADRQRDDVEEVLVGLARPAAERQVLVGCPSMLVGAVRAEAEQLPLVIRTVEEVVARLGEWVRLAGNGGLHGRASEYHAWRAAARGDMEAFVERTAVFRDRRPTAFPATYAALGDLLLDFQDRDEVLFRTLVGYVEGDDPETRTIRDVRRLEEGLQRVASAFVWETLYALMELPGRLAEMAVPAEGLPPRAIEEVWLRDLDRALADYQGLARIVSPRAETDSVQACGVRASLPRPVGAGPDPRGDVLLRAVLAAIRGATTDLSELRKRAGRAAQAGPIPVPAELRKSLDALLAGDEALRARVRACSR